MKASRKRTEVNDDRLIAPLATGNGVGEYLRYEPIYDEIKEARREDDDSLSQGIWVRDLKKADFPLVEQLCGQTLEFRSKDIQIIGWLTESWIVLDGIKGFYRGIKLCHQLMSTYWNTVYPQIEDGEYDARIHLLEWMNEQFSTRLMTIPLTFHPLMQERATLTLSDWILALNTETIAKRSTDYARQIADAEAKGKMTLSLLKKSLATTDAHYLQKNYYFSQSALAEIKTFFEFLAQKIGKQATGFNRIRTCLDDIARISKTTLEQRSLPLEYDESAQDQSVSYEHQSLETEAFEQSKKSAFDEAMINIVSAPEKAEQESRQIHDLHDDVMNITGRREAYQALRDIGLFLQNLDPHSPTPSLIELIVSWENKNLPSILEDLSRAPNNTQMMLRMLSSALPNANGSS
ncbi:MAG: hypothetical protein HEEMFOPI_00073 [Holosporales bacterium]